MDRFFNATHCDRCGAELNGRTQSWFNDNDVICLDCGEEESSIKKKLIEAHGEDLEGCGLPIEAIRRMVKMY